jgi:hypothetical protein
VTPIFRKVDHRFLWSARLRSIPRWILALFLLAAAHAQTPWWDDYPRIVHFMNQMCGARVAGRAPALNADVVMCSSVADPNVGIWEQRIAILEESEPQALDKLHASGLRTLAYFEAYGQAKAFVVQVRKNPDGTWVKDKLDPQLTRRFLNHWSWDRFDGTGEVRWAGSHNYFGDEEFARPYTLTHPRYGSPPVRYPDGTIATGYQGPDNDPRNSRVYDACAAKDVNGKLYIDYGYNRGVQRRGGPFEGLLQVGSQYAGTFDIGKDAACPSWIDYTRASVLQAIDYGLDGMWTDNFSPWDSFGFDPVHKAFGEWSVATFRDYLAAHFPDMQNLKSFDVRAYLRAKAAEWGGTPEDLNAPVWKDPRWLDEPIWTAYKIHRRQNGTQALSAYYHAVKAAAASAGKPDFPVTANDFQDFNLGWARGDLDMVNSELQYTPSAVVEAGRHGYMLPPFGSYVPVYKRAREQARGRLGIFWLYVAPELAGHPGIADVLQYQALANHILPQPWTGVAHPQTAGTDSTTAAFNRFLGSARTTFGHRTGVEDTGLYFSSSSELAHLTPNGWPDRDEPLHSQSFRAWGTVLSWLHYQWRVVPEWKLTAETLAGLKLLIIPNSEVFDPAAVPVLKAWVAQGGKLIIAGKSGARAGEKGNFQLLPAPSLANIDGAVYLADDPGPAFAHTQAGRPGRLQSFPLSEQAPSVPYTVGITMYDDAKNQRRFIDIDNIDIDVDSDTIHPTPPILLEVNLPAWLNAKKVIAKVLTPDGPDVTAIVHPLRESVVAVDVKGVVRYASVVLQ